MHKIRRFRNQINKLFDVAELEKQNKPITIYSDYSIKDIGVTRVNHFLIKSSDSKDFVYGYLNKYPEIIKFVQKCIGYSLKNNFSFKDRYAFITIDQGIVHKGFTLRDPGWHIDGLQGNEIKRKKDADFQFIWCDKTPPTFSYQKFNLKGFNLNKHNLFKIIESQIKNKFLFHVEKKAIILMNPYNAHCATFAKKTEHRIFIRLSFTKIPITSIKMTLNNEISYNYKVHTSSGQIPKYLAPNLGK